MSIDGVSYGVIDERGYKITDPEELAVVVNSFAVRLRVVTDERDRLRAEVERLTRERDEWRDMAGRARLILADCLEKLVAGGTWNSEIESAMQFLAEPR